MSKNSSQSYLPNRPAAKSNLYIQNEAKKNKNSVLFDKAALEIPTGYHVVDNKRRIKTKKTSLQFVC